MNITEKITASGAAEIARLFEIDGVKLDEIAYDENTDEWWNGCSEVKIEGISSDELSYFRRVADKFPGGANAVLGELIEAFGPAFSEWLDVKDSVDEGKNVEDLSVVASRGAQVSFQQVCIVEGYTLEEGVRRLMVAFCAVAHLSYVAPDQRIDPNASEVDDMPEPE